MTVSFWANIKDTYTSHYFLELSPQGMDSYNYSNRIAIYTDSYNQKLYTYTMNSSKRKNMYISNTSIKNFFGQWNHFLIEIFDNGDVKYTINNQVIEGTFFSKHFQSAPPQALRDVNYIGT